MENKENIQSYPDATNDIKARAQELLLEMDNIVLTINTMRTNGATHEEVAEVREKFIKATEDYISTMKELKELNEVNKVENE